MSCGCEIQNLFSKKSEGGKVYTKRIALVPIFAFSYIL